MRRQIVATSNLLAIVSMISLAVGCKSETIVERQCELGLNFTSITEFEEFIKDFLELPEAQLAGMKLNNSCIENSDAIRDLATLITRQDVCDMRKIDRLISYHKKYFVGGSFFRNRKPITYKFFARYAVQVAYVCKKNLITNLEIARVELKDRSKVFEEAKERVYNDEPSIKSNIKLIEEQPDDPATSNLKPQNEAELTLGEYREALTRLRLPEDILTFDIDECKSGKGREILVSQDKLQTFFRPAMICHQLHRYYADSLLSIAKLANIGYMARHEELDVGIANSPMVRDWIIAVQICEPMMHMQGKDTRGDMVVVDTCSEKISPIEPMMFGDSFDDFDNSLLDELVPRSEATRDQAQRIMKSALKRLAKIDLTRQLKAGANKRSIFKRSLLMAINRSQDAGGQQSNKASMSVKQLSRFSVELAGGSYNQSQVNGEAIEQSSTELSEKEAFDILMKVVAKTDEQQTQCSASEENEIDKPVSFDLMSSIASTLVVMAIMMVFEWVFFIVMAIAARICHELYFNFENLLTFPPKVLSWSDADFARYTDELERVDEDDFFDYEELNSEEQRQRELLAKVFGRPPPMLFKD